MQDKGCGYFDWHNEKLSVRAKSVIDELRQQIKHLKEENHMLRTEGEYTSKDDSLYWQSLIQTQLDKNYELGVGLKAVKKTKNILIGLLKLLSYYRLAPESPLPAALDDSCTALEWVVTHSVEEPWLKDYADFTCVFLAGDRCGANMAHHLALKLNGSKLGPELKIEGIARINPYFWGKDPVGVEITDNFRKSMVDKWWTFICPSDKGCDDPLINPFADGSPGLEGIGCSRLVVVVSEKDVLRDRGMLYYGKLVSSGWKGNAEVMEIKGEDHVFHIINLNCENAKSLFKRLASFINQPS
ncbi:probable carboxylesterase 2 [Euphorbia lathyris]|uniref:probable carboxylesterase 2 n=1 Tax=Euphorbia lathyris TaxID=212925 RepID=UPI0033141D10